jgi:oligogalacturonide transport system substrate-binding protein
MKNSMEESVEKTKRRTKHLALAALVAMSAGSGVARAADLRMSWWGGEDRHVVTQKALAVCGAKHGHKIAAEFTGFDGYLEKLTTQMAGGTEADIVQVNWPWLPLFSRDGKGFADLSKLTTLDLGQWPKDALDTTTIGGRINAVPVSITGRVFFFNVTSFKKAGVPVPTTWDELMASVPKLQAALGKSAHPFNAVKETAQLLVTLAVVQKTGKDLVDPATNRVAWSVKDLAAAVDFYGKLVKTGTVQSMKQEAAEGSVNLFEKPAWADGRIAGSYEWDSTYGKYAKPLQKDQVLEPRKMIRFTDAVTDGVYRRPSMVFAVSKNSKDPKAAAQILNCLLNEPEGVSALGSSRGLPASRVGAEILAKAGKADPVVKAANDIVVAAKGPAPSPFNEHPQVRSNFIDTLEEYGYGMISAEDAANQIIDGTNDVLERLK